ncbi:MAG TPA: TetR/AcrR family transcriptional regulator [Paracoccus sp. (in: a-proteobacteria)]|uniref:TetR/AcrR family transcriptional regulator n=1 Tax=uncultured Paracoccus sp. TaxID=189685 RepID=UPI002603EFD0|nr:TetR/AcrR family transcriptional regulator [uncultured Paracoccus sp.]HMQ40816.1 TetR/AcrR family transcriptional regulator [Paracoccus sp. (in: a-proteobacteria)]HMR35499.1 TetR/AcrR family transcriptional regulator [Paracoccus sp. (in: a-proteobacteria)]
MTDEPMLKNAAKPARRRTQAERSNATRTAVCEATLDALIEYGYERISTTLIAEKANVSRGALTHHYPTRNDLFLAAYQHLVDQWAEIYPLGDDYGVTSISVTDLIEALWDNLFATKHYIAALELMLAARIDNELGRSLLVIISDWIERRDTKAVALLGSSVENEEDRLFVQLILSVLRGIAVHQSFDKDPSVTDRLLEMWKDIARQVDAKRPAR